MVGKKFMQKLIPVEEAKKLMNEAIEWSIWRWLLEKRKVRVAADTAVDALNALDKKVKAAWSDDLKKAFRELELEASTNGNARARQKYEKAKEEAEDVPAEIKLAVQRVKEADDEAEEARLDAEDTFDEAERRMSADMAREGARKAIASWELREKSIRKAEAVGRRVSVSGG
jgi:hypothetical protein